MPPWAAGWRRESRSRGQAANIKRVLMLGDSTIKVLNRLVEIHARSLPRYLSYASPTWHLGDEQARQVLADVAAGQQATVDRLGEMILEGGGVVQGSGFPMVFTAYHDLSFEFLLQKLLELQRRDVQLIEDCVRKLPPGSPASAVAEESLGAARAYLESLEELASVPTGR
jgi:hypothetical protein